MFGREVILLKSASGNKNMRKCILTKELCYKSDLIRFVVGPNKLVVPDVAGRLPGRGLWLKAKKDIVTAACDKGIFTNVLKDKVSISTSDKSASVVTGSNNDKVVDLNDAKLLSSNLAKSAPIDSDKVAKLKAAISAGNYPLDLDKVSDALMQAYRDMKS